MYQHFSTENFHFLKLKKYLFIAWASFRLIDLAGTHQQDFKYKQFVFSSVLNSFNYVTEPLHEKNNDLGFRPGPTHTSLYTHKRRLEA